MRTNRTAAVLSSIGALALTAALFTSPAGATDRDGDADRDDKTSYTEDNDTNDGGTANNVEDDGDNRHPSGKDRSVESGGSGTQGRSESDPDDDGRGPDRSNGGPDKANGSGGVDLADQDGNNGCGNDDDFEDDNEGWCGNKPEKPESETDGESQTAGSETDGNGTAAISVDADCYSVHVSSSKDISNVVVHFADGSKLKFDGLTGHTWTRTFTAVVASADAKSATTVVSDTTEGCDAAAGSAECDAAATMDDDDACDVDNTTGAAADNECVDADTMTDGDAAKTCDQDDECVDADTMTDGDAATNDDDDDCALSIADMGEVLALEAARAVSSGGGATAVVTGADDAAVLGAMLEAPADDTDSGVLSSVSAGALAFTGDHIMLMVIVAMLALLAGTVLVRQTRRNRIEA